MQMTQPSTTAQRLMSHVGGIQQERERERQSSMTEQRLPFTIKRVRSEEDLWKAVSVRHAAYARHVPEFARTLIVPEESDYDSDAVILLAESKLDGSPLGSMRIQTNANAPLHLEASVELPLWLQTHRLAEVTRLGIGEGRIGHVVKLALIKASFDYCEQNKIEWAVVTGRAPIDRQYEQLLFADVFADKKPVPLLHVGNIPHRVMAFEIATGEARWEAAQHPLLSFFRHTRHPDIDVSARFGKRIPAPSVHAVRSQAVGPSFEFVAV